MMQTNLIFAVFAFCDLTAFVLYGLDKHRARCGARRISERALLLWALPGGIGAWLGMCVFHHKTRKVHFRFWVPLCAIAQCALCAWIILK